MKPIYIDTEFKCHTTNPDGIFREVILSENALNFFSTKCDAFIEGFRFKPDGENLVRDDGTVFSDSEMMSPWKDYNELDATQREYENEKLYDAENALSILLGGETG